MRICISGTNSTGKSTFISDFMKEWPKYTTPEHTYRQVLEEKKLSHTKKTSEDAQWAILNNMIDNIQKHGEGDKVIYDRGPIDNIVYSMWASSKGLVDEKFVTKCLPLLSESIKLIDMIFFIPVTDSAPVVYDKEAFDKDKEAGLVDESTREEVDFIFKYPRLLFNTKR